LNGKVRLGSDPSQAVLEAALRLAAENEARLGQRGIGVPASRPGDKARLMHVLPLRRGELRAGLVQRAVAALFVVPAVRAHDPPIDAAVLLYDLTPSEAQIFAMIAAGHTVAAAAENLGIAMSTARTHLLWVLEKTGCKRQVELVALADRLSPPLQPSPYPPNGGRCA
jgi:DNA-binding CsgD family transcriptional regulator